MGIALNRTDAMGRLITENGMNAGLSTNTTTQEIPPREVLRCQHCQLVQFRTQSDLCRRCVKPLPSWIPFGVTADEEENPSEVSDCNAGESEMPIDRAGRNRRISIGAKIKQVREERGLTQVEMSSLLEIPRSYLSRIENRRLLPGPLMVAKFAEALEMDISDLLPPERRKDGNRLFPSDAGLAALYSQIAKLPVQELGKVLEVVRRMVPGTPSPRRKGVGPAEMPQRPEAETASALPATKPASAPPRTSRLAIVAAKGSIATR